MNSMSSEEIVKHVLRYKNNYYKILMVERNATQAEIKVAYKRLALKCHPDKNTHAHAAEAFKLVGTAYTTLSDSAKRQVYDRQGVEGVQRHESSAARGAANGGTTRMRRQPQPEDFFQEFFFGPSNTFFSQRFDMRDGNGRAGAAGAQRGQGSAYTNVHVHEADINVQWLMLLPILFFILIAFLLQSPITDINLNGAGGVASSSGSGYNRGGGGGGVAGASSSSGSGTAQMAKSSFSLTPIPEKNIIFQRMTSLYGLHVRYYTTAHWNSLMDRRQDVLFTTEKEVLLSQRDYLRNRCEAETFKYRTRGKTEAPEVCLELNKFNKALGENRNNALEQLKNNNYYNSFAEQQVNFDEAHMF